MGNLLRNPASSTRDADGSEDPPLSRHAFQMRDRGILFREFLTTSEADAGNFTKTEQTQVLRKSMDTLPFLLALHRTS